MFWMRAYPLLGRPSAQCHFTGPKNSRIPGPNPPPTCPHMDMHASKKGLYTVNHRCINSFFLMCSWRDIWTAASPVVSAATPPPSRRCSRNTCKSSTETGTEPANSRRPNFLLISNIFNRFSGAGSVCFWAFWIRIQISNYLYSSESRSGYFKQQAKKIKKNYYFFCLSEFLMIFIFEDRCKCRVPTESNQQHIFKKTLFFDGILKSLTKRAGSGSGTVIFRHCNSQQER